MSQKNDQLNEISTKLDKVLRLLAVNVVKGIEKEQEKIELLDSIGFKPSEIARLLNNSPENVSVVLGAIRKKKELASKKTIKNDDKKDQTIEVKMEE